jgi:hypothetical protein
MIVSNDKPITDVYVVDKKTLGSGTYVTVNKVTREIIGQVRTCKTIPGNKINNWERF